MLGRDGRTAEFTLDPWLSANRVRSALALPIQHQCKALAVLYLEHELVENAFTQDRVDLLALLMTQAAIALQNAQLYEDMRTLSAAQARFVPEEFLQSLDRSSIVDIKLGENVRKEMSILFSDIRSFTTVVEQMSHDKHIEFINSYLSLMEPPISGNGEFIDSYIGDAVMALFDGQERDDGGVLAAVEAGVGMTVGLAELNRQRTANGDPEVRIGIGVHTGSLTLGTIGGPEHLKCGVIGEPVNLAARVESLTKTYQSALLVSGHVVDRLPKGHRFSLRMVGRVQPVGSQFPLDLYEVLDAEPEHLRGPKLASLDRFNEAVHAFYLRDFSAAQEIFSELAARCGEDMAVQDYLNLVRGYLDGDVPDQLDGVDILVFK